MHIALIADVFPPLRSSGAVQMRDLSLELIRQGHQITVMTPNPELRVPWHRENWNGIDVLRLRAPKTKDIGYLRRALSEFWMPYAMSRGLRRSPLAGQRWDGVIWYSPSIFLGPLVNILKASSACPAYLIIRDIFPEWAVDVGLMSRGLPYMFFKSIEYFQYSLADVIGVQTPANVSYFNKWLNKQSGRRVEVLHNWLAKAPVKGCSISISDGPLAGRKIFVYAGNMGPAQGMDILLELASRFYNRKDLGFLFVGRGNEVPRLRSEASARSLDNILFYDEIDPDEVPGLYAQCHIGLIALNPRHKTHNIPGKFLSYMQSGLPVLAVVNPGNDLERIIQKERVGRVCTSLSIEALFQLAQEITNEAAEDKETALRCRRLADRMFSPETAAKQIVRSLHDKIQQ